MRHISTLAVIGTVLFITGTAASAGPGGVKAGPHLGAPIATPTHTSTSALPTPSHSGQPNQSCGSAAAPNTPGNSASAPGSAFNPNGQAGTVYAGQQPQNSRNPMSVSQYDVACAKQPSK